VRVVIGEDETLLREGLTLVLERAGFEVVAAAADAVAVVAAAAATAPDLVLTDLRMPPTRTDDGLRAALRIRAARPGTAVVVLSQHLNGQYAAELLGEDASAVGYLLKQRIADAAHFCDDLRRVAGGGTVLDPEVVTAMLTRRDHAVEQLSPRRLEVLGLIAQGRSNAAISRVLHISEKSVVAHTSGIYDTLELTADADDHRRVLAVVRYLTR
jgi:DNA-binding NarL/FixJ family response regulator